MLILFRYWIMSFDLFFLFFFCHIINRIFWIIIVIIWLILSQKKKKHVSLIKETNKEIMCFFSSIVLYFYIRYETAGSPIMYNFQSSTNSNDILKCKIRKRNDWKSALFCWLACFIIELLSKTFLNRYNSFNSNKNMKHKILWLNRWN